YQAMAELDSNGDGVLDASDAGFKDLRVWVDANHDGVTDDGELKTLESLNIAKLNLAVTVDGTTDNGNIVGLSSTFTSTDGSTHQTADVLFQTSAPADLRGKVTSLVQAMASFGDGADAPASGSLTLDAAQALQGTTVAASVGQMADV